MNANPASLDYYERLGVSEDATQEEIRSAFKSMRKELHPDGRPESLLTHFDQMMRNVNEAHQALSDPERRAAYDQKVRQDAEKQQRQQEEEQARRHAEEEAQREEEAQSEEDAWAQWEQSEAEDEEEEEWDWSEEEPDPGAGEEEVYEDRPTPTPPGPAVGSGSWLVERVPGPVHRVAIYVAGSWVYLALGVLIWHLPFYGSSIVAVLGGLAVSVTAAVVSASFWKLTGILTTITTILPWLSSRMVALWFSQRVLESFAIAPAAFILSLLLGPIWTILSLGSFVYVALWVAEAVRWRAARKNSVG